MKKLWGFIKGEPVMTVAGLLAAISVFFVPPDTEYLNYCNVSVLAILLCLMLVVAGIKKAGFFDLLTVTLRKGIKSKKATVILLCAACFLLSALITNDVALITFVPFTLELLKTSDEKTLIFTVVFETIAANLGSLLTPIGNPQNLYLYSNYNMSPGEFFKITVPLFLICAAVVFGYLAFCRFENTVNNEKSEEVKIDKRAFVLYAVLFVACILSVFKIIPWYASLAIVVIAVLIKDRQLFKKADYILLITFVFFFVLVGNIARIPAVYELISKVISSRETVSGVVLSQIISNVPAATMLSAFTDNAKALIIGTNAGGLGTLIASMASLISYRFIAENKNISKGRYFKTFTVYNFAFLIIIGGICYVLF